MMALGDGAPHGRYGHAVTVLKRVAKKLVLGDRLDMGATTNDPLRQLRRRHMAPFSAISPYVRVRRMLDPVHHRHLLGSDVLQPSSSSSARRISEGAVGLPMDRLHEDDSSELCESTAFIPDKEVPLASVMIPLEDDSKAIHFADVSSMSASVNALHRSVMMSRNSISKGMEGGREGNTNAKDTKHGGGSEEELRNPPLPPGSEISSLPQELAVTFYTEAKQRLRTLFLPRVLFLLERKRRRAVESEMARRASRPSGDALKRFKLFAHWPAEALQQAVDLMTYQHVESNRFIWYTGEPGGTLGMVLISHGQCRSMRNTMRDSGEKRLTTESAVMLATHGPGHLFNEYSFVTQEPQMRYVKTLTRCDLFCLSREDFETCCATVTETVRAHMTHAAFVRRQKMIPEAYPFYPQLLRKQCPVFAKSSDAILSLIIQSMKPLASGSQFLISSIGETPSQIFFLRRGKVGGYQDVDGASTHVRSYYGPSTLLESCVIHRQENLELLRTLSDCDFLVLSLEDIYGIMALHPSERDILLDVSREEKMKILSKQQKRYRPLIYQIPIIRQLLEGEQINALSHLFEGRVYAAMDIVASKSDTCDRIIILTKGQVSFGVKGAEWAPGDSIGYTCLLQHRWSHSVVALQQTECIELRRDLFEAFMEDCGLLNDAMDVTELMMCPTKVKLLQRERKLVDNGVVLTEDVRQELRSQVLAPLRKAPANSTATTADAKDSVHKGNDAMTSYFHRPSRKATEQQARRHRLLGLLNSVEHDIEAMITPRCYPLSISMDGLRQRSHRAITEPGFVECRPQFRLTDTSVPGGLHTPLLTERDKEEALSNALFALKRDPVKRVSKITPFLMVKQR
ncbi:cyclic nucleotide-binding protein, putative [Bodo saltans]|uniref:Cyclic nucleotide-binding protein, putative n=1 Tax=Bodo saltans TaxID=75058 RepID=A0A0S4ISS9_BODSA|nr:cyclic nucleotide-binding protein, putative [Bodo saltans]|eukprot:CUG06172.1 cyclic nucleotide-binding protein, putative [Bodo saltans]